MIFFFMSKQWIFRKFCIGAKSYLWYTIVIWCLCKWKYIKGVIAVAIWQKSVIFLFLTYYHGKTTTQFENLKTSSSSAHNFGSIFVCNWNGYWKKNCFYFLLASVIIMPASMYVLRKYVCVSFPCSCVVYNTMAYT